MIISLFWLKSFSSEYGVRLILFPGSFVLTGLTEMAAIPFLGIDVEKLSMDDKAEILFLDQGYQKLLFFVCSSYIATGLTL